MFILAYPQTSNPKDDCTRSYWNLILATQSLNIKTEDGNVHEKDPDNLPLMDPNHDFFLKRMC